MIAIIGSFLEPGWKMRTDYNGAQPGAILIRSGPRKGCYRAIVILKNGERFELNFTSSEGQEYAAVDYARQFLTDKAKGR